MNRFLESVRVLTFVALGAGLMMLMPQLLWQALPDGPLFRGPGKGSLVAALMLIFLSWLYLRWDGRNLSGIGLEVSGRRLGQLVAGIGLGVLLAGATAWLTAVMFDFEWRLNQNFAAGPVLAGLWLVSWSAIAEELTYRGYALERGTELWGAPIAVSLLVLIFAIIHWFAWGAWGDLGRMANVLLTVGLGGVLFSLAYIKSRSVALPIGLHTGFLWANADFFTRMFARWYDNDRGLFVPINTAHYDRIAIDWWLINLPYCITVTAAASALLLWPSRKAGIRQEIL